MKSFKQYNEHNVQTLDSAEDDNKGLFNIQDPKSLQQLNGFVGSLADKEYLQPEAAIEQLINKLSVVGLNFKTPSIEGDKGNTTVEVTQYGGRYGKTTDNANAGEGDIEDGDGVSHKKEGGLKIEFNWEKQANNSYKVFANLV
tara:strand:+ start:4431 stop:4859 length:429 start_codon:yes stop_codon:yes gene_type:complete